MKARADEVFRILIC